MRRAPCFPSRTRGAPAHIHVSQTLCDQQRAHILSARSQHATSAAVVAARRSFRPGAAGAGDSLKIEATSGYKLAKPECSPIAQLTLRCASCSRGFRRVETDKPKGLARNPNRVAVQHLNLTGIER